MRESILKIDKFGDHYHVEGPDRKTIFFFTIDLSKNRSDQSRGKGLYPKESMTITI